MVTFTVRMRFSHDDRDKVAEILRNLAHASRQEPGCVAYVPHQVDGDAETILIYEQYRDQAAVDAHRATPHFQQYAVGGLYQLMKDRAIETLDALV
ncbi:Antibiotic biosynthesis monooxygenase [Acidisarcina polymorpha]|uniref:Antibiotic biosynthesis monooxygenase n=1 Tax=Acidisarcina polymorpha TaxID=2211140 RepID=A0A2Z5G216_9BACT|nr:putative quinol monooxygenase [Acidisarcina polymorpha]AXC13213.1 Antibiotic biosynthesis monooxygenase [Acidisarcina polymorpha]